MTGATLTVLVNRAGGAAAAAGEGLKDTLEAAFAAAGAVAKVEMLDGDAMAKAV